MAQAGLVRIDRAHHQALRQLAERMGESMQAVAQKAIDELKRQQFFDELDSAFAALAADENAWREELEERALWENTLADGLDSNTDSANGGGLVAGANSLSR